MNYRKFPGKINVKIEIISFHWNNKSWLFSIIYLRPGNQISNIFGKILEEMNLIMYYYGYWNWRNDWMPALNLTLGRLSIWKHIFFLTKSSFQDSQAGSVLTSWWAPATSDQVCVHSNYSSIFCFLRANNQPFRRL